MTDSPRPPEPPDDDARPGVPRPGDPTRNDNIESDEVVSAHLDGVATEAEAAAVESSPASLQRLGSFRDVAGRVGDIDGPPEGLAALQVGTALDAFGESDHVPAGAGADGGNLHALDARRGSFLSRLPLGAVAAVALVVALAGAIGLSSLGDRNGDDLATGAARDSAGDSAEEAASEVVQQLPATAALEPADESGGAGASAPTADETPLAMSDDAVGTPPPRRAYPDTDQLAASLREELAADRSGDQDSSTSETADGDAADRRGSDFDPCDVVERLGIDPDSVLRLVSVTVADEPVTAVVHGTEDRPQLVVVDDRSCQVIVDRAL